MNIRYNAGEVITAMATPFNDKLEVDYAAAEKLAKYLVNNGSDAILVAGSTGESPTLTHDEELELLKVVKSAVSGKAKVIIGAGSNSTITAVDASKKAEKAGADAILSVVPYYNKPSKNGQLEHFGQVAKAVDIPIIIYNIPGRTGINMAPDTIVTLAKEYSNIVALKQSNPDLDLVSDVISTCPDDFIVYCGDDSLTLPMLSLGAHGVISVASHLIGNEIKEMVQKFKAGDIKEAQKLHYECFSLFKTLFITSNPVPLKYALNQWGIINDFTRPPLVSATDEEKQKISAVLARYQKLTA